MRLASFCRCLFFLFSLALSCCVLSSASAASSYYEKVRIDNNLPNVGIYSITQDHHGYLWLASTNTGLLQFDGYQFQQHPLLNNSLTKLKSVPDIDAIVFDQHNNLWAGTWGYGLAQLQAADGSIRLFNGIEDALAGSYVQTLFKDQQHRIWIGTTTGINRYDDANGLSRLDSDSNALPSRRIWAFAETDDQTIWLATSNGLLSWHDSTGFGPVLFPHDEGSADNEIRALHVINNELWVGTSAGLFVYLPAENRFEPVTLPAAHQLPVINTLARSVNGHLLLGTFNGIYTVDVAQRRFIRHVNNQLAELEQVNVRSIFVDNSQVTWVGTRESGLLFKTRQRAAFQNSADAALTALQQSLTAPVLTLLAEPDQLWLGQQGIISQYQHASGQTQHFTVPGRVNVLRRAPDGSLWAGSDNGIFRLTADTHQFVRFEQPYTSVQLPQRNARDIRIIDEQHTLINLWQNGILLFDQQSGKSRQFMADISRVLVGDAIQATLITPQHIWLASRLSGIYLLDRNSLSVSSLTSSNPSPLLAPDFTGQLTCLATAPNNSVLVCTEQGLLRIWLNSGEVKLIAAKSGLKGSWLVGAHSDKHHNIWVMTTAGLDLIKADGSIKFFNISDGLTSNEMMFGAVAEDERHLYFGSDAGLELVTPTLLLAPLPPLQQAISKVTLDQQLATPLINLAPVTKLQVPATISRVAFHFANFDFNKPGRQRYLYKLQGYDDNWQQLNDSNVATYTNLAPGNYQLQLRAGNELQAFSDINSFMDITVQPHWWQRRSVQFIAVALAILLISYRVKRRIGEVQQVNLQLEQAVNQRTAELQHSLQQQQAAYDELQQLDLLKDQFISSVSHELRTPLTSISGALNLIHSGALSMHKQQQLLEIASSNSERLTLLINDLLDLEKLSARQMVLNFKQQNLDLIVQRAVQENSTYGQQRQVSLVYQSLPQFNALANVDEHRLLQVLANLLSNAIKFSPQQSVVTVTLQQQDNQLVISIADQGPGIAEAFQYKVFQRFAQENNGNTREQGGTGLGLALSKELMQAMHGNIWFKSIPGKGATFYLSFAAI
ncbi:ATP-binding protein [Arsukibacterium sp.]|uniref:ATP-binding protein n=1 Tax=Arsukibacterium sp. TaxID=1977258 RepID=UPI002FD90A51